LHTPHRREEEEEKEKGEGGEETRPGTPCWQTLLLACSAHLLLKGFRTITYSSSSGRLPASVPFCRSGRTCSPSGALIPASPCPLTIPLPEPTCIISSPYFPPDACRLRLWARPGTGVDRRTAAWTGRCHPRTRLTGTAPSLLNGVGSRAARAARRWSCLPHAWRKKALPPSSCSGPLTRLLFSRGTYLLFLNGLLRIFRISIAVEGLRRHDAARSELAWRRQQHMAWRRRANGARRTSQRYWLYVARLPGAI